MVSSIGINLVYNPDYSSTENFFYQLMGWWPQQGYSEVIARGTCGILQAITAVEFKLEYRQSIAKFFLYFAPPDRSRITLIWVTHTLIAVDQGLKFLRVQKRADFLQLYGEEDCAVDPEVKMLANLANLETRIQRLEAERDDLDREINRLATKDLAIRNELVKFRERKTTLVDLDVDIMTLGLSTRAYRCLNGAGLKTLRQLIGLSEKEIDGYK